MDIIDTVTRIVKDECMEKSPEHWTNHIVHVVRFAEELAKGTKADLEILILGALLHDYAGVKHDSWKDHHLRGAEEAQRVLEKLGYPQERIDVVREMTLNHRSSIKGMNYSPETKLLRDADALAHFVDIPYLLFSAYVHQGKTPDEAREWLAEKLERSWEKLSPKARRLVRKEREAARIVLRT